MVRRYAHLVAEHMAEYTGRIALNQKFFQQNFYRMCIG